METLNEKSFMEVIFVHQIHVIEPFIFPLWYLFFYSKDNVNSNPNSKVCHKESHNEINSRMGIFSPDNIQ